MKASADTARAASDGRTASATTSSNGDSAAVFSYKPLTVGVKLGIGKDPEAALAAVHSLGMQVCQLNASHLDDDLIRRLGAAIQKYGIAVTAMGTSLPGPQGGPSDDYDGPLTLGLVPRTYRAQRIEKVKRFSDAIRQLKIPAFRIHAGFIPEDPNDLLYLEAVETFRDVARHLKKNGQQLLYETGTETPVTLLRAMQDVGLDNQGVNMDTANFVLYGKANPVDALEILGPYVKNTHMKDGFYPTNTRDLGKEAEIPHGVVGFPGIIAGLRRAGYRGPLIIEREGLQGPEWLASVARERDYLEKLLAS